MKQKITSYKKFLTSFYIISFIVLYFILLIILYIIPRNYEISIVVLTGFAIIIIGYFAFINLNHKKENREILKLQILSENSIKIILLFLMILTFFIPAADSYKTVIDWSHIGIFNIFRAAIFLIGCLFLPGASLFNIFFPESKLHERFKIEPFFLKITVYPLLSIAFLGTITIILDRLELIREFFASVLFIIILVIIFSDLLVDKIRGNEIKIKSVEVRVSKYTLFILIIAMGVLFISIGIQISIKYLHVGDSLAGITMARFVGSTDTSPFEQHYTYTHYWGYVSFGLSVLSGLPYININVMLASFMYLSITSIYLLMKAIFYNFKSFYPVLSTIFICTYSSLFYIFNDNLGEISFEWENISMLLYDLIFIFRFKTYAFVSMIFSLALLIIILQTSKEKNLFKKHLIKTEEFKFIILGALFLIQGYIVYFFPILVVIPLIFMFGLFSDNKKKFAQLFLILIILIFFFFILFDILMVFIPSNMPLGHITNFLGWGFLLWEGIEVAILRALSIYLIFGGFLLFSFFFYYYYSNFSSRKKKRFLKIKCNQKNWKSIYTFFIIIFSLLLIVEFFNIFMVLDQNFLFFYLDNTILKIGCIGILGIYLSYYSYKNNRKIFFVLISWILFIFAIASILIIIKWFSYPFTPPKVIPSDGYHIMVYWYNRFWFYSIIPLSILTSLGLVKFYQKLANIKLIRENNFKTILKHFFVSLLIVLSVSNSIMIGIGASRPTLDDDGAHITGWVSEFLPAGSNILIDQGYFSRTLQFMTSTNYFFAQDTYEEAMEKNNCWITKWFIDPNCNISFINDLDNHAKILKFYDHNKTGSAFYQTILDFPQSNGTINFWLRTTNSTKKFYFYLQDRDSVFINLQIENKSLSYYDYNYHTICEIQNDIWYQFKIEFEGLNTSYKGLDKYTWNCYVNNTKFNNLSFWHKRNFLTQISLGTTNKDSEYSVYLDDFDFSWAPHFNIENCIPIDIVIDFLKEKNIRYLIYTEEPTYYKSRLPPLFFDNELIPKFFNQKLYEYGDIKVYYAPKIDNH